MKRNGIDISGKYFKYNCILFLNIQRSNRNLLLFGQKTTRKKVIIKKRKIFFNIK